jgi:hypothetical protein
VGSAVGRDAAKISPKQFGNGRMFLGVSRRKSSLRSPVSSHRSSIPTSSGAAFELKTLQNSRSASTKTNTRCQGSGAPIHFGSCSEEASGWRSLSFATSYSRRQTAARVNCREQRPI